MSFPHPHSGQSASAGSKCQREGGSLVQLESHAHVMARGGRAIWLDRPSRVLSNEDSGNSAKENWGAVAEVGEMDMCRQKEETFLVVKQFTSLRPGVLAHAGVPKMDVLSICIT